MNYFKSTYETGIAYSPNWYGSMSYAPAATVLLYNDNEGYCIGYMDSNLPAGVTAMTEAEAQTELNNAQDVDGVYFGDKLLHRWDSEVAIDE